MGKLACLAALLVCANACDIGASSGSLAARSPTPAAAGPTPSPGPSPIATPVQSSPRPSPTPFPAASISCSKSSVGSNLVMIGGLYGTTLIYDVTDPVHPRLQCRVLYTSAHLMSGTTFMYVNPGSADRSDIVLH